jgi:hypothetical protein
VTARTDENSASPALNEFLCPIVRSFRRRFVGAGCNPAAQRRNARRKPSHVPLF